MGAQRAQNQELLLRVGEAGLARITQGIGSMRSCQTIAAPGRTPVVRSFEDAASLFDPPSKVFECDTCSICLEPALEDTRKLHCGHSFHARCLSGYSCSQPAARAMPCPDCRQPFHAFQDQDEQGHAQARDVLADSRTALHMGIRHVRPLGLSDTGKEGSIKRERDFIQEFPHERKRVEIDPSVVIMQEEMQQINNELQILHSQSSQQTCQQALNLLHSASIDEILDSLPPSESRSQLSRKEKRRCRKLIVSARAKRRRENQQLAKFERTVRELKEQQKELQQNYLKLSETNQNLTAQLVTTLMSEACKLTNAN